MMTNIIILHPLLLWKKVCNDPGWLREKLQAGNRLATDQLPQRVEVIILTGT